MSDQLDLFGKTFDQQHAIAKEKISKVDIRPNESKVDWKAFCLNVESLLTKVNASYYIKESLRKFQ